MIAKTELLLTGDPKVVLTVSRTKDHADPAGLSVPLLVLSTLTGELPDNCLTFLSSNLWIATPHPMDVVVVSTLVLGNTSNLTHRCSLHSTHTLPEMELAELDQDTLRL